jgi:hypothetical protein
MSYKTNTGFSISDNDIKELLKDWDTNIQIGEQYSPLTIARFIIQILNNTKKNCHNEAKIALVNKCNEQQKIILSQLAKQISLSRY